MATLPEISYEDDIEIVGEPSKTWIIDKNTNQIKGVDDGLMAMQQLVDVLLNTERYKWQIYTDNFGVELEDLPGQDRAFIEAELPRKIEDAMSVDERIESVQNFSFTQTEMGALVCTFDVFTVFGTVTGTATVAEGVSNNA